MWRAASRNVDLLVLAAAACLAAGLFAVWAANGFSWTSSSPRKAAVRRQPVVARHRPAPVPAAAPRPKPAARPPRARPTLTLVAARGPAWVSIRARGRTVYEGLLSPRQRLTLSGPAYVARFQASANLVARVDGRRADLRPYELRRVAITRRGIRLLAGSPSPSGPPAVLAS